MRLRNRPVWDFGCRTGNSRKLILFPVGRILPDFAGPETGVFGQKFVVAWFGQKFCSTRLFSEL